MTNKMTYTKDPSPNWTKGEMNGYTFYVKHYEEGSEYGIENGRISKLEIRKDGSTLVNYDRGWDIRLAETDKAVKEVYDAIIAEFN